MTKTNKRTFIVLPITLIVLVVLFCVALMVGRYNISLPNFIKAVFTSDSAYDTERSIIINLRLPRTIIAALSGIALSLSGLLYQETFQNKLVSPDLLGVSNGAGVGAAIAILFGFGSALISLSAFLLGLVAVFITIFLANLFGKKGSMTLVLAGIIVGGLMSSILSIIKFCSDEATTLATITYWLMGSFSNATMNQVYILAPIVLIGVVLALLFSWKLNVFSMGKEEAQTKGIPYSFYKYGIIILSTLLTASTVAMSGTISWIGLVIPHMVRLISGKNTTRSIPLTVTFGGSFMILCDILSRTFTAGEIPLSAVTGLLGTIIFVIIIVLKKKEGLNHD